MGPFYYSDFSIVPMQAEEETAATPTPEAAQPSISQPPLPPVLDQQEGSDDEATLQRKKLKLEIEVLELKKQWYLKKLKEH